MTIMVPKTSVDAAREPRQANFPEGSWVLTLEEVRERSFPDFVAKNVAAGKNSGYTSGDGEILGLQFGSARSVDDPSVTTNQKHFIDLVVRDGNATIEDGPNIPDSSWQMQNSAAMLAMLAQAVGATEEVTDENGDTFYALTDDFLDQLRDGAFIGQDFGVTTWHRKWTSGDKSGTEVKTREIFQAV